MVTMKTVLAAGVFDLLHYGHIRYLEEAKKAGGEGARPHNIKCASPAGKARG